MKTKILLSIAGLVAWTFQAFPATYIITNSGFTFSPSSITIQQGDTVVFNLGSTHNAVEVSKDTWDANGAASDGGFSLGFGGGQVIFNSPGVFYYVCTPHASLGMKGVITVSGTTGTASIYSYSEIREPVTIYPNPFADKLTIGFTLADPSGVTIDLLDITGMRVQQLTHQNYMAGRYTEVFDLSYLKPGQYIILYNAQNKKTVFSLIKTD
jgi:plastocyanin